MLRLSRSPPHQPRDALQNHERSLPIGWEIRISTTVDPGRVYYANGRQTQWNFPTQEQAEAERQAYIQRAQAEQRQSLREKLALISNNDFNRSNMDELDSLRNMIADNEQPINISAQILDLQVLINMLKNQDMDYDLKNLCKDLFEEMFEKLAKEKELIDNGFTRHNRRDTTVLIEQLNRLNSIYNRFIKAINNIP